MAPEQTARRLLEKYRTNAVMWTGGMEVENANVKQCALIAVHEIMEALEAIGRNECARVLLDHYQQVKQIIQNQ